MTLDKAFGTVLQRRRTIIGISQEELAFRCELDRSFISLLERGKSSPTLKSIALLSKQLGVLPSTIIREAEDILQKNDQSF